MANANGTATVTVTVNDGGASNNVISRSFIVAVTAVNDAPTLNTLSNVSINENAGLQTVNLSGITTGASNEVQTLTVTAASSNPGLIPNPTVNYTSPNATGSLTFTPAANSVGTAIVTVTVDDGQAVNNTFTRTFSVTVTAVNNPPTITAIPDQIIATNTTTALIPFTVGDTETPATNLTVWASSSMLTLIPTNSIVFGGSDSNRTVTLTPLPGRSGVASITITVSDGSAISSTTFQLTVLATPAAPSLLTVITNGAGTVTPNLSKQNLIPGKLYTVTATPAAGQEFAGWSGSYNWPSTRMSFWMVSNLVLQANFVPSPYIPAKGIYNGLFYENDQVRTQSAGYFTLIANPRGTYSGRVQLGARRYSFSGKLDLECQATNFILRPYDRGLTVELRIGKGAEADRLFGRITDGTWTSTLSANRAVFNSRLNPAPQAGRYTLIAPGPDSDPTVPRGDGYGTVRVDAGGRVNFAGTLADGTKSSQSAPLSKNGLWPLYVPLYSGQGSLISWLAFTNQANDDLNGVLSWIKPANVKARYFPEGFSHEYQAIGSLYTPPLTITNNLLSFTNGAATVTGGNIAHDFANSLTFGLRSKVTNLSSNLLVMSFSTSSGTFRGTVKDPTTGTFLPFGGALLQKLDAGYGFLLGTNLSSRVILTP